MASAEADQMDAIEPVVLTEETAEKDHAYHIIPPSQRPHAPVKRRFDKTDDSTSQESTPAKLLLSNCDSMDASQAEGDNEGFILVEHRRKRTTGIPVLFTPTQEGRRLQQLNPLKLNDEVRAAAGAPFVRHRFTARGGLLVDVAEPATVNRLLKVRCLGEILVQATIPKAYMQNNGLIKGVPDWYSNSEMTEFLEPVGVIAARRLYQRNGKPDETVRPTDKVVITFRPNTERPAKVNLGFTRHEVTDYVEAPPRCFNCQALGHVAKYCSATAICKRCGGTHATKDCNGESPVKCANCGGDHPADYVNCKTRLQALAKKKSFIRGPKFFKNADCTEVERDAPRLKATSQDDIITAERNPRVKAPNDTAKKKKAKAAGTKEGKKQTSSEKEQEVEAHYSKDADTDTTATSKTNTRGKRSYSDIVTGKRPSQNSKIGDLVSLIFSVLPNLIANLPSGNFKTILQAIMFFQPAITEMTRNFDQSHD